MRNLAIAVASALLCCSGVTTAFAQAKIDVLSATTQVRKGEPFDVAVEVEATEDLRELEVALGLPAGFKVTGETKGERTLNTGSKTVFQFVVAPPGWSQAEGQDTHQKKTLRANVSFFHTVAGESRKASLTEKVDLTLSLNGIVFMIVAMVGLNAVGIVKRSLLKTKKKSETKKKGDWRWLLSLNVLGVIAVIGLRFVEAPALGWTEALGWGAALGLLADEDLLAKIKGD